MRSFWWAVVVVLVGAAGFAGGWIAKPTEQPVGGSFDRDMPCAHDPGTPASAITSPWAYRPGDDGEEYLFRFERRGSQASLHLLERRLPDDELEARVERYRLQWSAEQGWQVAECEAALRYWPDRP